MKQAKVLNDKDIKLDEIQLDEKNFKMCKNKT